MVESKEKKQIKELNELNDELENYFRNTIIPQLFVDADLILRKYTPQAMKQFQFRPEHIGKPFDQLVDNIRYSTILDNVNEVIETGEILEKEIQTTDKRWFQMNIIPYIIKKENKTNGVIITFVEITDRIRDLRELEKLNASHETFIYSVSHDLKAPLANIESLVQELIQTSNEMLKGSGKNLDEQKQIGEMLEKSVSSMKNIINELSEITKIEGHYHENVVTVSFEKILKEVIMTLKDKINESNVKISTDIQESKIEFSRKNIRSILYNLLSNAIKYRSPERSPHIHIKTEKENGYCTISIKDNGIGITEEKKDLIFTSFTRFEKNIEGSGIGLYLVKKIIENEEGKIVINSKVGEGTEFIIYLRSK